MKIITPLKTSNTPKNSSNNTNQTTKKSRNTIVLPSKTILNISTQEEIFSPSPTTYPFSKFSINNGCILSTQETPNLVTEISTHQMDSVQLPKNGTHQLIPVLKIVLTNKNSFSLNLVMFVKMVKVNVKKFVKELTLIMMLKIWYVNVTNTTIFITKKLKNVNQSVKMKILNMIKIRKSVSVIKCQKNTTKQP